MELYLLRHADAGDPGAWRGDDDDRPLSDKGIRQAERLAVHLLRIGFRPGAIVSSPRARARQTAEIVAAALETDVRLDERLARPLDLDAVGEIVGRAESPERVVLVGHDPDFTELLELLAGATALPMKKGALARLDLGAELVPGSGTLRWLIPPDALPRD